MSLFSLGALVAVATVASLVSVPVVAQYRITESSVAAGDSVYIIESYLGSGTAGRIFKMFDPVTRYDASTASLQWEAEYTADLPGRRLISVQLQTDAAGNIVTAAYFNPGTIIGNFSPDPVPPRVVDPWVMQFTVLDPLSGEPADAPPPSMGNADTQMPIVETSEKGIQDYQIVNGQVAGVFLQYFISNESAHTFLPGGGTHYSPPQRNSMLGMGYLGSSYDFVIMPRSGNDGRDLIRVSTDSPNPGFGPRIDYDSMIVTRPEPKNTNCIPAIDGSGEFLVYAAFTTSDEERGCWGRDFQTLAVQVLDRETLQAKWTATISGDYYGTWRDIALTSRDGKVYVAATVRNSFDGVVPTSVQLSELDGSTGAVSYTKDTNVFAPESGRPAHFLHAVHALSSGAIAITGSFDNESPVAFYRNGEFVLGTASCD